MTQLENLAYEERYVAFLDILGFTEIVQQSVENNEKFSQIVSALRLFEVFQDAERSSWEFRQNLLDTANRMRIAVGKTPVDWSEEGNNSIEHTMCSDTVVISAKATETDLRILLWRVAQFAARLLVTGVMVRGGIASGLAYHKGSAFFGPAQLAAYELESKVAKYPRILVAPEITSLLEGTQGQSAVYLREDFDGLCHLDVLGICTHGEKEASPEAASFINSIKTCLYSPNCACKELGVRAKYGWYRKYFHDFMKKYYPDLHARF